MCNSFQERKEATASFLIQKAPNGAFLLIAKYGIFILAMHEDPRNMLFEKVLELVDEGDLEYFSLGMFSKEKATELLDALNKSDTPEDDLFNMMLLENVGDEDIVIEESEKGPFEVSDISNAKYGLSDIPNNSNNVIKCIGYLHDLIERFRKGEAISMTSATLLKDGKSSIWIPNGFSHSKVDELFDPVVKELKESDPSSQIN